MVQGPVLFLTAPGLPVLTIRKPEPTPQAPRVVQELHLLTR